MSNRGFEMYQYRQIIMQLRLGESQRSIEEAGLASRRKIRQIFRISKQQGWLNDESSLPDDEILAGYFNQVQLKHRRISTALPYQDQIIKWVKQGVQLTTIHAALARQYNFSGSYDAIKRFVRKQQLFTPEVTMPLDFKPGECAQVDFGSGPKLIDTSTGEIIKTWVFVMVLSYSRHQYAEIVLDQTVTTWLKCHRHAFEFFNGVPKRIIIDNAKCAITKACYYDPQVQRAYAEYAEGYGFIISACPPRDPKKKGRVESGVKYIKKNFLPLREFSNLLNSNQQLKSWVLETAGNRIHGSTHQKPLTLFHETERWLLKPLPAQAPELITWVKAKVHGDCHVQFAKCRYSVPYQLVRQILWLRVGETTIRIYNDHKMITLHPRLFNPGSRHTLIEHLPPNGIAYLMQDPQWCLKQGALVGEHCLQLIKHLFDNAVLDNLRAVQGIISLQNVYGKERLEAACQRALLFNSHTYHTVKTILKKGIEYQPLALPQAFDQLAKSYTGEGIYGRNPRTMILH